METSVIMTDATYPVDRVPAASRYAPLRAGPVGLFGRWLVRRARRRSLHALKDLPPYLLDDIGLLQQGYLPSRTPMSADL